MNELVGQQVLVLFGTAPRGVTSVERRFDEAGVSIARAVFGAGGSLVVPARSSRSPMMSTIACEYTALTPRPTLTLLGRGRGRPRWVHPLEAQGAVTWETGATPKTPLRAVVVIGVAPRDLAQWLVAGAAVPLVMFKCLGGDHPSAEYIDVGVLQQLEAMGRTSPHEPYPIIAQEWVERLAGTSRPSAVTPRELGGCAPWIDAPLTPEEAETIAKVTPDSPDSVPWD